MSRIAEPLDRTLHLEWTIDATPEKLWRALTVKAYLEQWLLPAGDERSAASSVERVDFEVVRADPPHRLEWRWRELGAAETSESSVIIRLSPAEDGGTLLQLEQRALRLGPPRAANGNQIMAMAA